MNKKFYVYFIAIFMLFMLFIGCPMQPEDELSYTQIYSENFEGAFPGSLTVYDADTSTNGEYYWTKSDYKSHSGSSSVWAVGGGADGSSLSSGASYPNYSKSCIIFGPFDLSDAKDLKCSCYLWLNTESGNDGVQFGISITNTNFDQFGGLNGYTGSTNNSWVKVDMNIKPVKSYILGVSQVWIMIGFFSNESVVRPEGAYIDDVIIEIGK